MDYTKELNIPGILITVDIQKAFDCLEWSYLVKALKAFNFGPFFIQWVESLYKNTQSCVMNKGRSAGYFDLCRGVRQGDCLSPLLFVLALEIFLITLRSDQNIKGIKINETEIKNSSFADDLTCFLADVCSAKNLFKLLDNFKIISGLSVNPGKCEAIWLGKSRNSKETPLPVKWPKGPIKVVGIFISYDQKTALDLNIAEPIEKLRESLKCLGAEICHF